MHNFAFKQIRQPTETVIFLKFEDSNQSNNIHYVTHRLCAQQFVPKIYAQMHTRSSFQLNLTSTTNIHREFVESLKHFANRIFRIY